MLRFGIHDQIKVLTSCGYWETFTSEHSWTRVGQWLYEVVIRHILYAINKDNWGFFRWRLRWCWGSWCRRTPATWPPTWTATSARSGNSKEPDFNINIVLLSWRHRSSATRYTTYVFIIPMKIIVFFIAMVRMFFVEKMTTNWTKGSSPMVRQYHLSPLQSDRLFRGGTELNIIWDIYEISDKFTLQSFSCAALLWKPHVGYHFNWFFWGELLVTLEQQKLIPLQGYHWKRDVWHCNYENGATSFQRRGVQILNHLQI